MQAVQGFDVMTDVNVPTHNGIEATLAVGEYGKMVNKPGVPRSFPVDR